MPLYISQPLRAHIFCVVFLFNFISQASPALLSSSIEMISLRSILQFSLFASAICSPPNAPKMKWGACNETEVDSTVPIECGNLSVPLDYTEPNSNATLNLELDRVPAAVQPSKGSILFNFGGPGATGRDNLALLAPLLLP
jgi:hypothetical protein